MYGLNQFSNSSIVCAFPTVTVKKVFANVLGLGIFEHN
jgi:hypothetical protein